VGIQPTRSSAQPLAGRRIVITRAREQAASLRRALEARGAGVIELPTIAFTPPRSWRPLNNAIQRLEDYAWIIFTSANGVESFFRRLRQAQKTARALRHSRVAAIGPATAAALRRHGIKPDVMPADFRAEGLVRALGRGQWRGKRVLLARAAAARELLPQELRRRGAKVDVVAVYRTVVPPTRRSKARALFTRERPDLITFTSSSTAQNFARLLGEHRARRVVRGVAIAVIGPVTAATVRELGWRVAVISKPYTIPALVEAIVRYFAARRRPSSGR